MSSPADSVSPAELRAEGYDYFETVRVLALRGECDLATSEVLRDELGSAVNGRHTGLVLDLTQVGFCDAGCAGQMLSATERLQTAVAKATRPVRLVFDLLDPAHTVPLFDSVNDAARALSHP